MSLIETKTEQNDIDQVNMTLEEIQLNALAFCLVTGNYLNFINLIENFNASVSAMELLLEKQGLNGLDIVIEKGYIDLLKYYLPIYKNTFPKRLQSLEDSETSTSFSVSHVIRKLPVHRATENGQLDTLKFLYSNFSDPVPDKYSLHFVDEHSGENPALISCKKCDLGVVKFLFEVCKADFYIKSKRLEGALHLAAFGSKNKPNEGLEVMRYLVEVVKIDFTFQYEETLLILTDPKIIEYIELRLAERGIPCTKEEVEKKYSLFSESKNKLFDFTGAISSIDATNTINSSITSFFHELD